MGDLVASAAKSPIKHYRLSSYNLIFVILRIIELSAAIGCGFIGL
jgi:hypothetical protein